MRFFMKKQGGMVSVFLAMILVPLMAFSTVCVEAVHYRSSFGILEEAMDISENAVLADYDTALFEKYGLMALKETGNEKDTFLSILQANMGGTGATGINCLMDVSESDMKDFKLSAPLSDAGVLKGQIMRCQRELERQASPEKGDAGKEYDRIQAVKNDLEAGESILEQRRKEINDCVTVYGNMLLYRRAYNMLHALDNSGGYDIKKSWSIDDGLGNNYAGGLEASAEDYMYASYIMIVQEYCAREDVATVGDTFVSYCREKLTRQEYPIFVKAMKKNAERVYNNKDEEGFDVSGVPKNKQSALKESLKKKKKALKKLLKQEIKNLWKGVFNSSLENADDVLTLLLQGGAFRDCEEIDSPLGGAVYDFFSSGEVDDGMMYYFLLNYLKDIYSAKNAGNKNAKAFCDGWKTGEKKEWKPKAEKASEVSVAAIRQKKKEKLKEVIETAALSVDALLKNYEELFEKTSQFQELEQYVGTFSTKIDNQYVPDYFALNIAKEHLDNVKWGEISGRLIAKLRTYEVGQMAAVIYNSINFLKREKSALTQINLDGDIRTVAEDYCKKLDKFIYDGISMKNTQEYYEMSYPEQSMGYGGTAVLKRILLGKNIRSDWKTNEDIEEQTGDVSRCLESFGPERELESFNPLEEAFKSDLKTEVSDITDKEISLYSFQDSKDNSLKGLFLFARDMRDMMVDVQRWYLKFSRGVSATENNAYVVSYMERFTNIMEQNEDSERKPEKEYLVSGIEDTEKSLESVLRQIFYMQLCLNMSTQDELLKNAVSTADYDIDLGKYSFGVYPGRKIDPDMDKYQGLTTLLLFQMGCADKAAGQINEMLKSAREDSGNAYDRMLLNMMYSVDSGSLIERAGILIETSMKEADPAFSLETRPTQIKVTMEGIWKNLIPLPSIVADQPVMEEALPEITVKRTY
ncbi:MAG: hypothetical protein MR965_07875 [Lachnospiraceae bacterium]|nr:hypothetical protein [Lachnospiraceae bacterium]